MLTRKRAIISTTANARTTLKEVLVLVLTCVASCVARRFGDAPT
jgi:hypothetical protein